MARAHCDAASVNAWAKRGQDAGAAESWLRQVLAGRHRGAHAKGPAMPGLFAASPPAT
jgi:hypothetical protein